MLHVQNANLTGFEIRGTLWPYRSIESGANTKEERESCHDNGSLFHRIRRTLHAPKERYGRMSPQTTEALIGMAQVAVASTDTRIDGQHGRVTYYQESDIDAYYVSDEELAELCRLVQEQTVSVADDELIELIDGLGENGKVFM